MPEPEKVVRLSLDPTGMPVPPQETIPVRKDKEKVKFCANFPFTISIDGYDEITTGPPDADGPHNCKTGLFREEKKYKYTITANGKVNDPILDVQP